LPNGKVLVAGGYNGPDLASAELFDPAANRWTLTGAMTSARVWHTATLLANGKVLVAGGGNNNGVNYLNSAELFDGGVGFDPAWQPRVDALASPIRLGGTLTLNGAGFGGISGGSGGTTQDSPTDYPFVQLRSVETEQTALLPTTNWSANSLVT